MRILFRVRFLFVPTSLQIPNLPQNKTVTAFLRAVRYSLSSKAKQRLKTAFLHCDIYLLKSTENKINLLFVEA